MTQLEQKLAEALGKQTGIDILGIIEAARGPCACEQTVGTSPATKVETAAQEPAKRTRKTAGAVDGSPVAPAAVPAPEPEKPAPEPEKAPPAGDAQPSVGIDITGLFEGSGASKKLVKSVFMAAVEKASSLASLVALNAACDCGFATGDYTEETAPVLKRKLTRWGAAQE